MRAGRSGTAFRTRRVRVRIQTQELDLIIPEGVESVGPKAFDAVKTYVETIRFPASFKSPEG